VNIKAGTLLVSKFTKELYQVQTTYCPSSLSNLQLLYIVKEYNKRDRHYSHTLTLDQLQGLYDYCPAGTVLFGNEK
jgi:hypothetical protein